MADVTFSLKFDATQWFFDKPLVERLIGPAQAKLLGGGGALVRTIARRSMRYVTAAAEQAREVERGLRKRLSPVKPSAPGNPPHAIRPHPWIREHLYFALDPSRGSVVVGPVGLVGGGGAPSILERGGRYTVRNTRRRKRHIGGGGEIRVGGRPCRTSKPSTDASGATVMVAYARLRTAEQVRRANQLNEQIYGAWMHSINMPARPYMAPALALAAERMPELAAGWMGSVRGRAG